MRENWLPTELGVTVPEMNKVPAPNMQDLSRACVLLLGSHEANLEQLSRQQWPDLLRAAFRKRAFETHPDRASVLGRSEASLTAEFQSVDRAYALLTQYLSVHAPVPQRPPQSEKFHRGGFPRRSLRFGEFLYYSGVISSQQQEAAVAWQRPMRPRVGDLAVRHGLLTSSEVDALLERRARAQQPSVPLATWGVQSGVLRPLERRALLARQRALQPHIGQYFVQQGLLTPERLNELLHCARRQASAF